MVDEASDKGANAGELGQESGNAVPGAHGIELLGGEDDHHGGGEGGEFGGVGSDGG